MIYRTLRSQVERETVVRKSRFIAYLEGIDDEAAAEARLNEIRAQHRGATHVCYAYICDRLGNSARFSDAGEPGGTAGMPMLEVLRKRDLKCVFAAVVRYFGGILLGAGGLVRAYSGAVAEAIDAAGTVTKQSAEVYRLSTDYVEAARLRPDGEVGREYGDAVCIDVATTLTCEALTQSLAAKLGRTVELERIGETWLEIPE